MSPTERLDRLSAEQLARLPAIRDEWLSVGLATGPGERAAAEEGVRGAYREAGLEPPALTLWLSSPLHGLVATGMLKHPGSAVPDQVWDQVRGQVWDQVGDQVGSQVGSQVWDQVRGQVRGQVWDQVGGQVRGQVWDQVGSQVGSQVWDLLNHAAYGQHDSPWLGFYAAFREFGVEGCKRLVPQEQIAREAGWWWPMRGVCIVTERPTALHRDERNRLHCETGPALDYAGTFGVWAWHGRRVAREVIEQPQTTELILGERNAEIRRVRIERFGLERLLLETKAIVLDEDVDGAGQPRRLLSLELPDDPEGRMVGVHVQCPSTGHQHVLQVPPTVRSCSEAVAWTFGIDTVAYAPLVEA